jgi:hypothetical protein
MTSLLDHQLYAVSSECHITSNMEVIVPMELNFVKYSDGEGAGGPVVCCGHEYPRTVT